MLTDSESRLQYCRFRFGWIVAAVLFAAIVAPSALHAQDCGGNSTVDALGAETARGARAFLAQLQSAVRANSEERIAGMVNYPLLVVRPGSKTHIRQKAVFLARYDRIFTPPVRDAILHQTARCLFGNSSGAMVGNGQLWFREQAAGQWKIITVNLSVQ